MLDTISIEPRYELEELISADTLKALLIPFVKTVKLAAGIVRNPMADEDIPRDPQEFPKWRVTPVLSLDRQGELREEASPFCKAVRELDAGDVCCMTADFACAKTAYARRCAIPYDCEAAGLRDIVAPITVGGHHLANVYLGQLRGEKNSFDATWKMYQAIKRKSTNANEAVQTESDLRQLYDQLWSQDEVLEENTICEFLTRLADLISQRASRQATLRAIATICADMRPAFDRETQSRTVLEKIGRALRFTSGSITLVEGKELKVMASAYPNGIPREIRLPLESEEGIIPYVCRQEEVVRFNSREDIDKFIPSAVKGSRDVRRLQSLLAAPLVTEDGPIGVIEVGDTEQNVYSEDDEYLIKILAQYLATHWKSSEDYRTLTSILQQGRFETLLEAIAHGIPELVHGRGCSIFLRDLSSRWRIMLAPIASVPHKEIQEFNKLPAFLVATSEFPDMFDAGYAPMMGLTGWVLGTGRALRIDGGKHARTTNLPLQRPPVEWKGLFRAKDPKYPMAYYEDRPFLAVPITASNGVVLGVIRIPDSVHDNFSDRDQDMLEACASTLATAQEAAGALEAMERLDKELCGVGDRLENLDHVLNQVAGNVPTLFQKSTRRLCVWGSGLFASIGSIIFLTALITPIAWTWKVSFGVITAISYVVLLACWKKT